MRTSNKGIAEIASHEGIVPYPYLDVKKIWTEGVGHTASAGPPDPSRRPKGKKIPLEEVFDIFRRDLKKFENRVNDAIKVPLTQNEFDALVSFDYNTGGIYKAALTRLINQGKKKEAAEAFMGWKKPASIIKRRKKEQSLFREGLYSNNGHAPVYTADVKGKVDISSASLINVSENMTPKPIPKSEIDVSRDAVRAIQQMLLDHGYVKVGAVDGLIGDNTRGAIRDFRAKNDLPQGSNIDAEFLEALKQPDVVRPVIAPERANKTLKELDQDGSEIADAARKGKKGAIATITTGVTAVAGKIVESAGGLANVGPALSPYKDFLIEYGPWLFGSLLVVIGAFFFWQARKAGEARLKDHRTGNTSVINIEEKTHV